MPGVGLASALTAHRSGDLARAETLYRGVLEAEPDNAEACRLLAACVLDTGRAAEALPLLKRALKLADGAAPEIVAALETNLGNALRLSGQAAAALDRCRRAVDLAPQLAEAQHNLGIVLIDLGRRPEAVGPLERALALAQSGDLAGVLANLLGSVCFDLGQVARARGLFERALAERPDDAQALNNLANALTRSGDPQGAIALYEQALTLQSDNPTFLANLGGAHQARGDIAAAMQCFERALRCDPGHADARWNRGIARLLTGDLAQGFADYEARWSLPEFAERRFKQAKWDGGDVTGHTVLIHSEQGFGDTIQMIRFAAALKARGARVVMETHAALARLMETAPGVDAVVVRGVDLPPFDLHIPMMSLPRALRLVTLGDIPASVPYLHPRNDARIILPQARGFRVGIAWAGRPTHRNDPNRSLALDALAPLAAIPGVQLVSLQVGERAADLTQTSWGNIVVDLAPQLTDFALTASAISQLDLVIAVDTAVAHLAGALAKPCWVLLPFAPDWRWLLDRSDSPWYPTLRLFRQPVAGEWAEVMDSVARALRERAA